MKQKIGKKSFVSSTKVRFGYKQKNKVPKRIRKAQTRKREKTVLLVVRERQKIRARRKEQAVAFVKLEENPIIAPKPENDWEAWQTFNPGIVLIDDKVHVLYRAIGEDGISRLGYAVSYDGFNIDERLSFPVYQEQLKNDLLS